MVRMTARQPLRVLIVGGGGREHALAWKLRQSPLVASLHAAPGNPGIAALATIVPISTEQIPDLVAHARTERYDLVVVGPEDPLSAGLVDQLESAGISTFGPTAAAARLESSKHFMKEICKEAGIPTTDAATFTDYEAALVYARTQSLPLVIKADGLCKGKGVTIASSWTEAEDALRMMLVDHLFGDAGRRVVIEAFLRGREVSVLALCDGTHALPLLPARDHKRAYDGDLGPNTGGMGAYAPAHDGEPGLTDELCALLIQPAIDTMRKRGTPFHGVLFANCMLTAEGPRLLEFNCRFGDPETEAILPLLESDLLDLLLKCHEGTLEGATLRWKAGACANVVMASAGYPQRSTLDVPIVGLDVASAMPDVLVFHAGTAAHDGVVVTAGGRVLCVCGIGADTTMAAKRAYEAVAQIQFDGAEYRRDIGNVTRDQEGRDA